MFIRTAIISVILSSTFITVTAFAQSTGQPGGGPIRLSDLGCGPGEIARVNGADEWECSDDLSTNEATAAEALSTARQALNAAASPGGFVRTIIVSPLGPSAVDNGGELLAAIDIATNAVPPPSAENPVLVALEPGVYDVGSDLVYLVPNVGLRGSGKGLTRIVGRAFSDSVAVIVTQGDTLISDLSVTDTGFLESGLRANGAALKVANVELQSLAATGAGTEVVVTNADIGGVEAVNEALVRVFDSRIDTVWASQATALIAHSQISFPAAEAGTDGVTHCIYTFNDMLLPTTADCTISEGGGEPPVISQ